MKKTVAILGAVAFLASAGAVHADDHRTRDIVVRTNNSAYVQNSVQTHANTGHNTSVGGDASVLVRGRGNDNNGARGGNTGEIKTGDATAKSVVTNNVNGTDVRVDADCGCRGDVRIHTQNEAVVGNSVMTAADSGNNTSVGGNADTDVRSWWRRGRNRVGNDRNNATGGSAGEVDTGDATSVSDVLNSVNQTMVRVTRRSNN